MSRHSGFTFKVPAPPGAQPTPGSSSPGPWSADSESSGPAIAQQTRQEGLIDPAEIDRIIPIFDSKEYQEYKEIQKLALRVAMIEKKNQILSELVGGYFVNYLRSFQYVTNAMLSPLPY